MPMSSRNDFKLLGNAVGNFRGGRGRSGVVLLIIGRIMLNGAALIGRLVS